MRFPVVVMGYDSRLGDSQTQDHDSANRDVENSRREVMNQKEKSRRREQPFGSYQYIENLDFNVTVSHLANLIIAWRITPPFHRAQLR